MSRWTACNYFFLNWILNFLFEEVIYASKSVLFIPKKCKKRRRKTEISNDTDLWTCKDASWAAVTVVIIDEDSVVYNTLTFCRLLVVSQTSWESYLCIPVPPTYKYQNILCCRTESLLWYRVVGCSTPTRMK